MPSTTLSRRDAAQPLSDAEAHEVLWLSSAASRADGAESLSEQFRLSVEARETHVLHVLARDATGALVGYAQGRPAGAGETSAAELVVAPDARRRGVGTALLRALPRDARIWSHSDSPAAASFAAAHGLRAVRSLLKLERPLQGGSPWPPPAVPETYAVRSFELGRDETEWLRVNAAAFAHHPEQGALERTDLDARAGQPWFDPSGFILVVERDDPDRIVAFHWTKVDPPGGTVGEVYVVGVAPGHQRQGLGRTVTILGLDHLRARGLERVVLYVDEDNVAAVRTYRALGFETAQVHRQYAMGDAP